MEKKENASAPATNGRRRALQGLAAPLVMTAVPGSALAATSTTGACLVRSNEEAGATHAALFKTKTDEWVRVRRQLFKLKIRFPGETKFKEQSGKRYFLGFDNATFWELRGSTAVKTGWLSGAPDVEAQALNNSYTYAIAYVDMNGVPQNFGLERPGGSYASSISCWNSLKGLTPGGSKFLKL